MKSDRKRLLLLIWVILCVISSSCNYPGLSSPTETEVLTESPMQHSPVPPKPTRPMDVQPSETLDGVNSDQPSGGPYVTSSVNIYCRVEPLQGSETAYAYPPGSKIPAIGITPDRNWIALKPPNSQKPCWVFAAEVELEVGSGNLEIVHPPATSTPALGSIGGVVWHEICEYSGGHAGEPVVLGQGCVQWGDEAHEFGPNQIFDAFESGWEGVTLHLGAGVCPSTGLATTVTDVNGIYLFDGLSAGTYCVSYSNLSDGNDAILIPGGPTYPERGEAGFYQTVNLAQGESAIGVDFGYAWQFYN